MSIVKREYNYSESGASHTHVYLHEPVAEILKSAAPASIFEIGCGNGNFAAKLAQTYQINGIDNSESGIRIANETYPDLKLFKRSVYEDLVAEFGTYDVVLSLEVVEHLFYPRIFAQRAFELLMPGGQAIISTPYHGYLKNLALAVSGKMDGHFTALWDGGHIKFWSKRTLKQLLEEAGFMDIRFKLVGRLPMLAKSMIATARKPTSLG